MTVFENTTADLGNALTEASNATGPVRDELKYQQARDAGWIAPQAYSYESAKTGGQGAADTAETIETIGVPVWAHQAVKYEWQEEYGDVGPEVSELEAQLFKGDTRTRIGQHLEK